MQKAHRSCPLKVKCRFRREEVNTSLVSVEFETDLVQIHAKAYRYVQNRHLRWQEQISPRDCSEKPQFARTQAKARLSFASKIAALIHVHFTCENHVRTLEFRSLGSYCPALAKQ